MNTLFESVKNMFSYIVTVLSGIRLTDIIDVCIVAFLLYYVYKFIRDRRAGKLAAGVMLLMAFMLVSESSEVRLKKWAQSR